MDESYQFGKAEVVTDRPRPEVTHSTRLPVEWSAALEAEAGRRGTNPSKLMADLIIAGLQDCIVDQQATVTVSRAALHQALDQVLRVA